MATLSNQAKNATTITNQDYALAGRTWDETVTSWDTTPGTWEGKYEGITNQAKN